MAAIIRRHPRKLVAGVMLIGAGYGISEGILPNPLRTPGVANIENRYSAAGGSKNVQPGASSRLGDSEAVMGNEEKAKGIGSPHHEKYYQGQKPDPSGFDKTWNKAHYHSEKGK